MDSKEVRARALDAAVRIGAAWKMESASSVVGLATIFEQYIDGSDTMRRVRGATPIKARLLTEETLENIWGRPCATCGHSTGVHLPVLGCEHPDGCECAWPDTSAPAPAVHPHADDEPCVVGCAEPMKAPAPEKCEGCTQGSHPHVFAKCSNCECTDTVGAPEPAGTPQCTCTHPYLRRHSDEGCAYRNCPCTFTGSAPAPEPASAPECGCPHRAERHGPEAGCVECKCTWTGSASAPEPTSAPECKCGHPKSAHSGAPQHCTAWMNDNTVCPCEGYER